MFKGYGAEELEAPSDNACDTKADAVRMLQIELPIDRG